MTKILSLLRYVPFLLAILRWLNDFIARLVESFKQNPFPVSPK